MAPNRPKNAVNLDANASYGLLAEVRQELDFEALLNPSSIHAGGQAARASIELVREEIASFLGLEKSDRIICA